MHANAQLPQIVARKTIVPSIEYTGGVQIGADKATRCLLQTLTAAAALSELLARVPPVALVCPSFATKLPDRPLTRLGSFLDAWNCLSRFLTKSACTVQIDRAGKRIWRGVLEVITVQQSVRE